MGHIKFRSLRIVLFISLMLVSINVLSAQHSSTSSKMLDSLLSSKPYPKFEVLINRLDDIKRQSVIDKDTIIRARCLLYQSSFYSRLSDYVNLTRTILECNSIAQDTSVVPVSIYISSLNNAATLEKLKGNHKKANEMHLRVLELEKSYRNRPIKLSRYYHNLALNYMTIGDFKSALSSITQAINYAQQIENSKKNHAESVLIKGEIYYKLELYSLALAQMKSGLVLLGNPNFEKEGDLKLHINANLELARVYFKYGHLNLARLTIEKVQKFQQELAYRVYKREELASLISIEENRPLLAIDQLNRAIQLVKENYKSSREYPVLARLYKELGDVYKSINQLDSSLISYQKGLIYLDPAMGMEFSDNPNIFKINATTQALDLLHAKSKITYRIYQSSLDEEDFNICMSTYLSVVQLIDKMKQDFLTESSQFFVAEQAIPIYQEAIDVLSERFKISNDKNLLEHLFTIIGKNKSSILFQSIKRKYDLLSSSLPNEILELEATLSTQISFYNKLISEEKLKSEIDSINIVKLENALFEANEKYILHKQHLKIDYKEYYNFKNEINNNLSIRDVQQKLKNKDAIAEYFIGINEIYYLITLKNEVYFQSVPITDIIKDIEIFKFLISQKPEDYKEREKLIKISKKLASDLIDQSLLKEVESIIIIPDGILGQIPFGCMIDTSGNSFLLENYSISYYYSTDQYFRSEESKELNNKILCIAPQFQAVSTSTRNCDANQLGKLTFAKEEVEFIADNFNSKVFLSENTKTSNLIDNIKDYSIIHLATHACINTTDPMLSELHFNNGSLTNYDIQDLNVRPELVVLSACNTAQGEVRKGEGLISLTRGFFEAGIKSLQSSLWSIDDYASSEIIKGMYSYLKEGNEKSVALQKAKIDYLATADKLRKHPYYWAGLVHIGNDSPLVFSSRYNWKWILTSFFIVIFVFLFIKYRK